MKFYNGENSGYCQDIVNNPKLSVNRELCIKVHGALKLLENSHVLKSYFITEELKQVRMQE